MVDATPAGSVPSAYNNTGYPIPDWLNKGDNAWQMTAATLVGMQSVPGLVVLYGSIVKKKWAINSAFMAFYAFAAVLICWVIWAYKMSFGEKLIPIWGKAGTVWGYKTLQAQATLPATTTVDVSFEAPFYPMATMIYFQFVFAAITLILLAGSVLGRMNFIAWMLFVPLWVTFSYSIGAFSLWGGGFLFQWGVIDYSGGYVIHLSSGVAGFTSAYWVGPRLTADRERFPPNNVLLMLAGAGLLWLGWAGFNGGDPYAANVDSSIAVINTNVCAAMSLLTWTILDVIFFGKPSVIGAVQGMITGLVCITPAAGVVQGWAAMIMGILSGSIPWYTMMIVHKRSRILRHVDDTLGVFHTHAVAGSLGGICTGLFAQRNLANYFLSRLNEQGAFYGGHSGGRQFAKQLCGALFIIAWNLVVTSIILNVIRLVVPLRMSEENLLIGDDAVHGEEAYALWGDGEKYDITKHGTSEYDDTQHGLGSLNVRPHVPAPNSGPSAAPNVEL
ncbi:unnamed protein product [Sphagnum troendelagicum]|uniref:Ammonium transporter n=1 Tax=Sphagnum troendelagicum TaxID=128251 RepID=A0ABP0TFL1_9BRYO